MLRVDVTKFIDDVQTRHDTVIEPFWRGVLSGLSGPAMLGCRYHNKVELVVDEAEFAENLLHQNGFDAALREVMVGIQKATDDLVSARGLKTVKKVEHVLDKHGKLRQLTRNHVSLHAHVEDAQQPSKRADNHDRRIAQR